MSLRVKEPFGCSDGRDGWYAFAEGDFVDDDHPAVKGREALFETVDDFTARTKQRPVTAVEQATAAPGERRHVSPKPESKGK